MDHVAAQAELRWNIQIIREHVKAETARINANTSLTQAQKDEEIAAFAAAETLALFKLEARIGVNVDVDVAPVAALQPTRIQPPRSKKGKNPAKEREALAVLEAIMKSSGTGKRKGTSSAKTTSSAAGN
ncbi:hypothetical protein EIP91_007026 [Steccherinum ochraceum]|uniref:Uncharacterized protein n=1 Tax=Steccherinum ochraceum TaxID=92696 RepID=A0A4R0S0X9_9APHY|nr:hypothetical protein EIP91_007026 [Steccherinum ochraceum]